MKEAFGSDQTTMAWATLQNKHLHALTGTRRNHAGLCVLPCGEPVQNPVAMGRGATTLTRKPIPDYIQRRRPVRPSRPVLDRAYL